MTKSIFIGPAGWSYRDWNGVVYPPKQEKGFDPLAFVSFYFNLVEINSTFYRTPGPATARNWVKRVADNPEFLFTAKAHQNFTHARGPISQTELDAFKRALSPIYEEGRLGFILVQFPWSFRYSRESKDVIHRLATALAPLPVAFEVRHGSWAKSEAIAYFRELGVTLSGIDQPVIGNSLTPKTHIEGTNGAYFRLHGRNAAKWFNKDSTRDDRYDYLYCKLELCSHFAI